MGQIQEYLAGSVIASLIAMSIVTLIFVIVAAVVVEVGMEMCDWLFGADEED